jgi:aminoglycoside 6'-N-acetyltransferase/ribosomal-protein-alanine N-acetyltransferase
VIASIEQASPEALGEIAGWEYEPPYDFYDGRHETVKNPERYFSAHDADGLLVGFYYFDLRGDILEYGLGLRPDLTGLGQGLEFFRAGLEFGRERFRPRQVVLAVAAFNERAIRVYERAGFVATGRHVRSFPELGLGDYEFVDMEERC